MDDFISYKEYQDKLNEDKILSTEDNLVITTRILKRKFVLDIIQNNTKDKFILSRNAAQELYDALNKYLEIF